MARAGVTPLPDGTLRSASGGIGEGSNWPEGTTPLDTPEQRNWIIRGPDGEPWTPEWIRGLEAEGEGELAIGAATRTITAGPANTSRFRPTLVGSTLAHMPTIGAALARRR
ncbi:hypothetical protein [Falsiroseomonas sp.]|uniref:hypothetical protein n=1 Tax=Falsiroseomonas sp. TaxID=2870721 RepID=UPI003563B40A